MGVRSIQEIEKGMKNKNQDDWITFDEIEWLIEQVVIMKIEIKRLNEEIEDSESQMEYIKEIVKDIKDTWDSPALRNTYMDRLTDFLCIK